MAIERRPNQQDLSWFLDVNRQGQLNLTPPYQRKSIWVRRDKQFFLNTIFNNYPCPAIYIQKDLNENNKTLYNVVDGKQRLTAIFEFYENKLRLPNDFNDIRLDGKLWKDIDDLEIKKSFLNYALTVEQLSSIDSAGWNDVFDRLNRNSKTLSEQELRHARYSGWFISRAELEATDQIWRDLKISSPAKARRMKDVEFISILMLVVLEKKIVGFPQSALDRLYSKYDDLSDIEEIDEEKFFEDQSFNPIVEEDNRTEEMNETISAYENPEDIEEDFEEEFSNAKAYLLTLEETTGILSGDKFFGAKRTTHLYTLWTYITLCESLLAVESFAQKYTEFFRKLYALKEHEKSSWSSLVDSDPNYSHVITYFENAFGASTEEPQRRARLEALEAYVIAS